MIASRLAFVFPPHSDLVSGGNIYNRELVAAARLRRPVEELSVEEWLRQVAAGTAGTFFVDTLNMREFLDAVPWPGPRGQRHLLVVHHLPSLEPGLPAGDPSLAVERAALPRFDGFLATSPYTAALLAARGLPQPCLTVRPALPPRPRPALELRPGVRALIAGNVIPRKGVLPFIDELAAAMRQGDRLTVDVVGRLDLEPEHAEACVRAAREAGLEGETAPVVMRFLGPASYEEMDAHYSAASVLVSPSLMETFGMALQEARACGLPILACRGGNAAAHIEEGAGLLFDSVGELVNGLLELVRSPEAQRRLFTSAQAARSGGDYTWEVAAGEFLRKLDEFERSWA